MSSKQKLILQKNILMASGSAERRSEFAFGSLMALMLCLQM